MSKLTDEEKIEALRFALSRWDEDVKGSPTTCSSVQIGVLSSQNDCDDCKQGFLLFVRSILDDAPAGQERQE